MKRWVSMGCALAAWSAYGGTVPTACDVNGSGAVDAVDVQLTVNAALGLGAAPGADVDLTGAADAVDIQWVINAALGIDVDPDGDGLCDGAENTIGTHPYRDDTDNDGNGDYAEWEGGTVDVVPDLGPGASLNGWRLFPDDNAWNTPIDTAPVDPNSEALIASIGLNANLHPDFGAFYLGGPFGIPYVVVPANQVKVPMSFRYDDQSEPGPYPIPPNAPIEGGPNSGGDRHILVVDRDNWALYEVFAAYPDGDGGWDCGSGAIFDLNSNALRPAGWTSADAAGLPILAGLVRYDEVVEQGEIEHALRFTCAITRRAYVHPATHYASDNTSPDRPPMGMRVRLKAAVDISGYPPHAQTILRALKKYGMILADNGSNWYLSGAPDARWDDDQLNALKAIEGSDFEVVQMGAIITD